MNTITLKELTVKAPLIAALCTNMSHPQWCDFVSQDLKTYQFSFNNNGPVGWLKVVE